MSPATAAAGAGASRGATGSADGTAGIEGSRPPGAGGSAASSSTSVTLRVKPPSSQHARPITATPQELIVNIARDGRVLVAGRVMTPQSLDELFAKTVAENPRQAVVVRGDRLGLLQLDQEPALRLDVCEECKGYLKTWTGAGDAELFLSDWSTLHLDVLARDRGFRRLGASLYELEA